MCALCLILWYSFMFIKMRETLHCSLANWIVGISVINLRSCWTVVPKTCQSSLQNVPRFSIFYVVIYIFLTLVEILNSCCPINFSSFFFFPISKRLPFSAVHLIPVHIILPSMILHYKSFNDYSCCEQL